MEQVEIDKYAFLSAAWEQAIEDGSTYTLEVKFLEMVADDKGLGDLKWMRKMLDEILDSKLLEAEA